MAATRTKVDYDTCGAKNKGSGHCRRPAGWGTSHVGVGRCKLHGGSTPTHVKSAEVEIANRAARALNLTVLPNVHPGDALLNEVRRCQQMVTFISEQIEQLEYDEVAGLMVTKVTDEHGVERTVGANVWVKLLGEWSDRLSRTSKTVIDAGIQERQTRLIERQAEVVATVMYGILNDLDVTVDDRVMTIVRRHLLSLDSVDTVEAAS